MNLRALLKSDWPSYTIPKFRYSRDFISSSSLHRGETRGKGEGREEGEGREKEGRKEREGRKEERGGEVPVHHHELLLPPLRHNVDNFVADIQTLEEGISCFQQNFFIRLLSFSLSF